MTQIQQKFYLFGTLTLATLGLTTKSEALSFKDQQKRFESSSPGFVVATKDLTNRTKQGLGDGTFLSTVLFPGGEHPYERREPSPCKPIVSDKVDVKVPTGERMRIRQAALDIRRGGWSWDSEGGLPDLERSATGIYLDVKIENKRGALINIQCVREATRNHDEDWKALEASLARWGFKIE